MTQLSMCLTLAYVYHTHFTVHCFLYFQNELRLGHHGLNLIWMADRSSCFLEQGGSRDSLRDAWTQCLAGLLEPHLLPDMCPSSIHIAWPYAYNRMVKAYGVLDPG